MTHPAFAVSDPDDQRAARSSEAAV